MDRALEPISKIERAALRKRISDWARDQMRESRHGRPYVASKLRQSPGWLSNRLSSSVGVTFWPQQLQDFARILGVGIPPEIAEAAVLARAGSKHASGPQAGLRMLDTQTIAVAGTASREMALILQTAAEGRAQKARDLDWSRRRFGLTSGKAETLEEIGAAAGVTRERVRQVEGKVIDLASIVVAGLQLPMLASIHQRVLESVGLPWDSVEKELKPFLGDVSLREAVRFLEAVQPPDQLVGMDRASIYGLGKTLRVVATSRGDVRFTSQVSTAARKIFSFAGAALVNDIRALLESVRKRPVPLRDLVRTLGALPEIQWLDAKHRWCWFDTPELSPLLRRVAAILTAARAPVHMETLYAGLVREGRRDSTSHASEVTDPVPPAHVVHAILKRHPEFRRGLANSFTYEGSFDLATELEPAMRLILDRLDELGGAATRAELFQLENHPAHPIPRKSFAFYLYCSGIIERIGPAAWAIRGRAIDETRRQQVLKGGARTLDPNTGQPQRRPSGPRWSIVLPLTDSARRNRLVSFSVSQLPEHVAGPYRLHDGHEAILHQDRHGSRLTCLGDHIKSLISDSQVAALCFEFDADAHELYVSATM